MELGEIKVKNVDPIQYYDDIYKLEFVNTNIKVNKLNILLTLNFLLALFLIWANVLK